MEKNTPKVVVISDLHVGAGELDDFDGELEGCLRDFLGSQASAIQLVINGDLLDFVQAPPYKGSELESSSLQDVPLCFTEQQSLRKLDAIASAHGPTFEALGNFLSASPENVLVILPGNHDADFYWKRVRNKFIDLVCGNSRSKRARVRFHLEMVYRPEAFPGVWIEHGHQYDQVNCFCVEGIPLWGETSPPLLRDRYGRERLYECIGTRLLIRFLNDLDSDYPYVDNVKPFSKFVRIFLSSVFSGHGADSIKGMVAAMGLLRFMSREIWGGKPSGLLEVAREANAHAGRFLLAALKEMEDADRKKFRKKLEEAGLPLLGRSLEMLLQNVESAEPVLSFLEEHLVLLEGIEVGPSGLLGVGGEEGTMELGKSFLADETQGLKQKARDILGSATGVKAVIMGHTHEPVYDFSDLRYINTGSWTRYYRFQPEMKPESWRVLRESYKKFPYELNYAEVDPESEESVRMLTYRRRDYA